MTGLPKEEASYRSLFELLNGALKSRLMVSGLELGIFGLLNKPVGARDLAEKADLHPVNTARFLDALTTIGLLEKKDGLYRNNSLSRTFLSSSSPTYIGDLLLLCQRMTLDSLDRIPVLVRKGPSAARTALEFASPERWAEAARASAQWVYGEVGQLMAGVVSALPGAAGFTRVLDLGGGHGAFALYILEAQPGLRAVIMDRAPVLEAAAALSRDFGFDGRVELRPGDYLQDDLGSDYDLIFASATLNFAKDSLDELFVRIRQALKPCGFFLSFQDGLTAERTKPETMLGHLLDSLENAGDYLFEQGEIAEAMLRAGFRSVRSRTIDTPMGPMDLDIARH